MVPEMCLLKYCERLTITVVSNANGIYRFLVSGKQIGVWLKNPEAMTEYFAVPQTVDSLCFGFQLTDGQVDLFVRNAMAKYVSFPGTLSGSISEPGWDTIRQRIWESCASVQLCSNPNYGASNLFLESREAGLVVTDFDLRYVQTPLSACTTAVMKQVLDDDVLTDLRKMPDLRSLYVHLQSSWADRRRTVKLIVESLPKLSHLTIVFSQCLGSDTGSAFGCEDLLCDLPLKHLDIEFTHLLGDFRLRDIGTGGYDIRVRVGDLPRCQSLVIAGAAFAAGELERSTFRSVHLERCRIDSDGRGPEAERFTLFACFGPGLLSGGLLSRSRRVELLPEKADKVSAFAASSIFILPWRRTIDWELPYDVELQSQQMRVLGLCHDGLLSIGRIGLGTAARPNAATFLVRSVAPWSFRLIENQALAALTSHFVLEGLMRTALDFDFEPLLAE
ncbi:MAG: hypothetical protein WC712_01515 [Candidatus Brocadiia bacterium]